MRVVLTVVMLLSSCNDERPKSTAAPQGAPMFECYRTARGPWRECAPKLTACGEQGGCFKRETAYCFPYLIVSLLGEQNERATVCTATAKECAEWHEDRLHVPNRALGPCIELKPDEYPTAAVPTDEK